MRSDLDRLCEKRGVRVSNKFEGETREAFGEKSDHMMRAFRVTLHYQGRQLTTSFYQGMGHTAEPTAADVISCLCSDARGVDERSFEDWASDYGYDVDSRKAERTYKACRVILPKIQRLLGEDFDAFADAEH